MLTHLQFEVLAIHNHSSDLLVHEYQDHSQQGRYDGSKNAPHWELHSVPRSQRVNIPPSDVAATAKVGAGGGGEAILDDIGDDECPGVHFGDNVGYHPHDHRDENSKVTDDPTELRKDGKMRHGTT